MNSDGVFCTIRTNYPIDAAVKIAAKGAKRVAVRIPSWCKKFSINKPYEMQKGYAVVDNDGGEIAVDFDMTPTAVFANTRVLRNAGRLCVMRGPIVYCAEAVDNGPYLHDYLVPADFTCTEELSEEFGLPTLDIQAYKRVNECQALYSHMAPKLLEANLRLIPYNCFANRGESDMLVWFFAK